MFNACVIDLKNYTAYNYISVVTMHIQTNFSDKTQQLPFKSLKGFLFFETNAFLCFQDICFDSVMSFRKCTVFTFMYIVLNMQIICKNLKKNMVFE